MRAQLKSLHSPDVDLESFVPEDSKNFGFLLQAMIGPEGEDKSESFDIQVCTPGWLLERKERNVIPDVILGLHQVIVFSFDLQKITGALDHYCRNCVADDWAGLTAKLKCLGAWEFEGYH